MSSMNGKTVEEDKNKWIKRNKSFIKRLTKSSNDDNVIAIVMAIELVHYLIEYTDLMIVEVFNNDDEHYAIKSDLERKKGRGTRIMVDMYQPAGRVNFIYRKHRNNIRFDIPCVCGFYKDEPHGNLK